MNNKRRRILLITAHPDDECMFFAPSIREFISEGCCVDLLCLSSGNYDGLGPVRTAEVRKSAAILGIETVLVINDP
jgi:N-acetylglucosaminylphosphatidylinositol deacetylase